MQAIARPLGVKILAVLEILTGIIGLVGGFALLAIAGLAGFETPFLLLFQILGVVLLVSGGASFVMAYGLWKAKHWAWLISLIFAGVGIALGVIGVIRGSISNIGGIALYGLILFYLTRTSVKVFFGGKQAAQRQESVSPVGPSEPRPPPVIFPKPSNPDPSKKYCNSCGFPLLLDWKFCPTCSTQQM